MYEEQLKLTVLFEDPFWIGVFERFDNGKLSVSKVTFGAEPKDYEIYEYVQKMFHDLQFSPEIDAAVAVRKKNPKRVQREIAKSVETNGIGTKSQQALKLLQEQNKKERKVKSRRMKKEEAERMFELKQEKKKEKHRGR